MGLQDSKLTSGCKTIGRQGQGGRQDEVLGLGVRDREHLVLHHA